MNIARTLLPDGHGANDPEMIAIHAMGEFIKCNQNTWDYYKAKGITLELNRDYHAPEWLRAIGVSAHQLIFPDGTRMKCKEDNTRAWHAREFNDNSLGAEFLVKGVHTYGSFIEAMKTPWVSDKQFESGQELYRYWMGAYSIEKDQIKYHYELSPERKKDPGTGFPSSFRDTL